MPAQGCICSGYRKRCDCTRSLAALDAAEAAQRAHEGALPGDELNAELKWDSIKIHHWLIKWNYCKELVVNKFLVVDNNGKLTGCPVYVWLDLWHLRKQLEMEQVWLRNFSKCPRLPFLLRLLPWLSIYLLMLNFIHVKYLSEVVFKSSCVIGPLKGRVCWHSFLMDSRKADQINLYCQQVFASRLPLAWARRSSAAVRVVTTLRTRAALPPTFQYRLGTGQTSVPRYRVAWWILFERGWPGFDPGRGPIWNVCVSSSPSYLCCQCGTAALIGHEWLWDTIGIKRSRQLFTREQVYSVSRDHLI